MSKNDFSRDIAKANHGTKSITKSCGPKKAKRLAERRHDRADQQMYRAMESGSNKSADFNHGQAMGYGMYAHARKKLKTS